MSTVRLICTAPTHSIVRYGPQYRAISTLRTKLLERLGRIRQVLDLSSRLGGRHVVTDVMW